MKKYFLALLAIIAISSCKTDKNGTNVNTEKPAVDSKDIPHLKQEDWVKNAMIYEINTRQFSKEGTFLKVEEQLPRIKDLGIDILWFMPIHEIGVKNRKEGLGSYYSVKDYRSINHEFGTKEDFKRLVDKAHEMGFKVIIDWVPNHTAWDHPWITEHPDYYTINDKGEIIDPVDPNTGESWGWSDVADLNFDNKDLWKAMHEDMKYWVTDFDIDGFRCDVAGAVPLDFWKFNNPKLNEVKPLFMLAEAHDPELFEMFNMIYSWNLMGTMNDINEGKKTFDALETYMKEKNPEDLMMNFTANHDENTWNDAPMKYGENYHNYAVLTYFLGGMPLIYNGQEAELEHKLAFFEKDEIVWEGMKDEAFFKKLVSIYKENPALWNGSHYGEFKRVASPEKTFVFTVTKDDSEFLVVQNYTDNETIFKDENFKEFKEDLIGNLIVTDEGIKVPAHTSFILKK